MEAKKVTDTTILTNLEAEKHFSVNGRTLRRKAAKTAELNPKMVSKCTDGHYRALASNWKKILGLH